MSMGEIHTFSQEEKNLCLPISKSASKCDIRWLPLLCDWLKMNSDNAVRKSFGVAACGGLLRDADGVWKQGFA